jgi:ketosteroid isomerase-like protein
MMVNLKAAMANTTAQVTDDDKAAAAAAFSASSDKQVAASDSVTQTVEENIAKVSDSDTGSTIAQSAKDQFLAYMNQSDAEKVRQQLTGVSKEEYDAMTPEEQAAVDKKVADLQKQKSEQQIAEQEVKTKIAMAKAEMA